MVWFIKIIILNMLPNEYGIFAFVSLKVNQWLQSKSIQVVSKGAENPWLLAYQFGEIQFH